MNRNHNILNMKAIRYIVIIAACIAFSASCNRPAADDKVPGDNGYFVKSLSPQAVDWIKAAILVADDKGDFFVPEQESVNTSHLVLDLFYIGADENSPAPERDPQLEVLWTDILTYGNSNGSIPLNITYSTETIHAIDVYASCDITGIPAGQALSDSFVLAETQTVVTADYKVVHVQKETSLKEYAALHPYIQAGWTEGFRFYWNTPAAEQIPMKTVFTVRITLESGKVIEGHTAE